MRSRSCHGVTCDAQWSRNSQVKHMRSCPNNVVRAVKKNKIKNNVVRGNLSVLIGRREAPVHWASRTSARSPRESRNDAIVFVARAFPGRDGGKIEFHSADRTEELMRCCVVSGLYHRHGGGAVYYTAPFIAREQRRRRRGDDHWRRGKLRFPPLCSQSQSFAVDHGKEEVCTV